MLAEILLRGLEKLLIQARHPTKSFIEILHCIGDSQSQDRRRWRAR